MNRATVCYLYKAGAILLAKKQRKIGRGLWNGYGGFEEADDESIEHTALREMHEEMGVSAQVTALEKVAVISYSNKKEDGRLAEIEVHFYLVHEWEGEPVSTEEMANPTWFPIDALPFDEMMTSDILWLSRALAGKKIKGVIAHDENKEVISSDINEVDSL